MKQEQQEFSRTSTQWTIHPKYDQAAGNNYDLCLVKIEQPFDLITGNILCFRRHSLASTLANAGNFISFDFLSLRLIP